jgi:sulfur-oxidizing protein SoxA
MNILIKALTFTAAGVAFATAAYAGENKALVINEEITIPTHAAAPAGSPLSELISGWEFRKAETQALQMDDFDNPAFIFVDKAKDDYAMVEGTEGKSCAECHGDVESFKGLRTVLPRWNEAKGKVYAMENYINECRTERMGAEAWKWSKGKMSGMTALISLQSRGLPMAVKTDGPAATAYELGKELYYKRVGQLDMACSNCHEDNYDVMIRADHLSQGHINGFPTYRLKNAKINSTHGRFKGCMKNIRAEPYGQGSAEFKALELYVASRGNGLPVESPAVRN